MKKKKVHVISMGCVKNLVDSEKLMAQLGGGAVEVTPIPEEADIAVINTCGFIEAAKRESIDMLITAVRRKSRGRPGKVYAMGCLSERYREELMREIPELDGVFGTNEMGNILRALGTDLKHELLGERVRLTPQHFAYLKVSEGCDNPCSFCAIPIMRGKHASRSRNEVLEEARNLAAGGVKELILIGQDTTFYGLDTEGERTLPSLVEAVADIGGLEWVRLMYAYPAGFPMGLLEVIRTHPRVCTYLDMPIQHSSDLVLKSMRRGISARKTRELVDEIRSRVPGIALRTTLIVGYPTETERAFDDLVRFVQEVRFSRLGVFTYSREDGTGAYALGDPIPADEKERRRSVIMEIQKQISEEENEKLVGTRQRVMVDSIASGECIGRTERDAPEVDGEICFTSVLDVHPGDLVDVDIMDASEYDLFGIHSRTIEADSAAGTNGEVLI